MMYFMLKPHFERLTENPSQKHEGTSSATTLTYFRVLGLSWEILDNINPISVLNKKEHIKLNPSFRGIKSPLVKFAV